MIRNAVLHISNEQPLLADLYGAPTASDVGLLCTNLRTMDGRRPIFVDDSRATFFFPYLHIRFVEIPVGASSLIGIGDGVEAPEATARVRDDRVPEAGDGDGDGELELDEEFLRKIRDL